MRSAVTQFKDAQLALQRKFGMSHQPAGGGGSGKSPPGAHGGHGHGHGHGGCGCGGGADSEAGPGHGAGRITRARSVGSALMSGSRQVTQGLV